MDDTLARKLRMSSTPAERAMWRLLFPFRTDGFHFRKQVPIGRYVTDMACHHAQLVIEIDGDSHGSASALTYDAARDQFLQSQGYTVLRFTNAEVLHNSEGVFLRVEEALSGRPKNQRSGRRFRSPPHKGEGERS
jgi:very-short-patch-repair endonuclease